MKKRDKTTMGGHDEAFQPTRWTDVLAGRTLDEVRKRAALSRLAERYWRPVYCYLRRKGHGNEEAKDLTQGFFQTVFLERDLVRRAEPDRGRFRSLMLTAVNNYVRSEHRAEVAQKRRPENEMIRLDALDAPVPADFAASDTPEKAFHQAWASALLDEVLCAVKEECLARGQQIHWEVFCARVLGPIMTDAPASSLAEICRKHGIAGEEQASNMIVTVKRKFQKTLMQRVGESVGSDAEAEEEILDLARILSGA